MDSKKLFNILETIWLKRELEKILDNFPSDFDYNIFNESGRTPLIIAIKNRSLIFVEKLIECGADINFPDKKGKTPLIYAYEDGQLSRITQFLLLKKANPEVYDNNLLARAVQMSDIETVELLLTTYPDINMNIKIGGVLPLLLESCGYCDEITTLLCCAAQNQEQIEIFKNQLSEINNLSLIESRNKALDILGSISLELNLQKKLGNKSSIKKTKI